LIQLGLRYSCSPDPATPCHLESTGGGSDLWVSFGARPSEIASADEIPERGDENFAIRSSAFEPPVRVDSAHRFGSPGDPGTAPFRPHGDWTAERLREHYESGRLLLVHEPALRTGLLQQYLSLAQSAAGNWLMWQATLPEFARWWTFRRQIRLQAWRTADGYEVHANSDTKTFPWTIEIWRGSHRAILPLRQPVLTLRDDGLVFLRSPQKSPSGTAIRAPVSSPSERSSPALETYPI
jgi:hypothetical protein